MNRHNGSFFGSSKGVRPTVTKQLGEMDLLSLAKVRSRTRRKADGTRIKTFANDLSPLKHRRVRVEPSEPTPRNIEPPCRTYAFLAGDSGANDRYILYPSGVEVGPLQTREAGSINWYSAPHGAFLSWAPGQRRHNQLTGVTALYNKKKAVRNRATSEDLISPIPFFGAAYSRAHSCILIVGIENDDPSVYRIGALIDECGLITAIESSWTQVGTASWPSRAQDEQVATARGMYFNQSGTRFVFSTTQMSLVQMDVVVDKSGLDERIAHFETLSSALAVAMQPKRRLLIQRVNVEFVSSYCSGTEYYYKEPLEGDVNPCVLYVYGDYRYDQLCYMKQVYTRHYSDDDGVTNHHLKRVGDNYRLGGSGERVLSGYVEEKTARFYSYGLTSGYAPAPYDGLFTIAAEFVNTPIARLAFSSASEDYNARDNYYWLGYTTPPAGGVLDPVASTLCAGTFTGGQTAVGDDLPYETAGLMLYALDLRAGFISYYSPTAYPENWPSGIKMSNTFLDRGWWLREAAFYLARIGAGATQFYRDPYYCWSTWTPDWSLPEVDTDTIYDLTAEEFTLDAPFTFFTEEDSAYTGYTGWHFAHLPGSNDWIVAGHIMVEDGIFATQPTFISQTFKGLQLGDAAFSTNELDYPRTIMV